MRHANVATHNCGESRFWKYFESCFDTTKLFGRDAGLRLSYRSFKRVTRPKAKRRAGMFSRARSSSCAVHAFRESLPDNPGTAVPIFPQWVGFRMSDATPGLAHFRAVKPLAVVCGRPSLAIGRSTPPESYSTSSSTTGENYATAVVTLRTANDIITRVTPLMIMLTPTRIPIAQKELNGHCM